MSYCARPFFGWRRELLRLKPSAKRRLFADAAKPEAATLLTATKLAAFRGERLVFKDLSFALRPGGAILLHGPNGAGKSSLLRVVAGLTPLAAGTLSWEDENALADLPTHAKRIGWLGHQDAVKPALTVRENVFAPPPTAALQAVGLEAYANLPARLLSAGQKRRLAIARVAASATPLWLLDEPTTGLDDASISQFLKICDTHRAGGGMILTSTHTPLDLPGAEILRL